MGLPGSGFTANATPGIVTYPVLCSENLRDLEPPLRNRTVDLLLTINSCGFVSLQVRRLTSQKASVDHHQQSRYRHSRVTRSATQNDLQRDPRAHGTMPPGRAGCAVTVGDHRDRLRLTA